MRRKREIEEMARFAETVRLPETPDFGFARLRREFREFLKENLPAEVDLGGLDWDEFERRWDARIETKIFVEGAGLLTLSAPVRDLDPRRGAESIAAAVAAGEALRRRAVAAARAVFADVRETRVDPEVPR